MIEAIFFDSWGTPYAVCTASHPDAVAFGPRYTSRPLAGPQVRDVDACDLVEDDDGWTWLDPDDEWPDASRRAISAVSVTDVWSRLGQDPRGRRVRVGYDARSWLEVPRGAPLEASVAGWFRGCGHALVRAPLYIVEHDDRGES